MGSRCGPAVPLASLGILLVALNLRTAASSISPIASQIAVDIPLDNTGLGLIGMVPPVIFAVSSPDRGRRRAEAEPGMAAVVAAVAMVGGLLFRAAAVENWGICSAET